MEATVCHSVSHSRPFHPNSFTYKRSLQWVTGLVQGLWLLLHYQYWIFTETPLGYPAIVLCHGDPAALVLQDQSLHVLQQFIYEVDVWGRPTQIPTVHIWGRCWGGPTQIPTVHRWGRCWGGPTQIPTVHIWGRCWGGPTQIPGSGPGW